MNVFENNGYFFEGERGTENATYTAPDWTRKRIKCHGDVQLIVGNFMWHGMFTEMSLTSSADTPYFNVFDLGFLAWKERFIGDTPWLSSLRNDVVRGHDILKVEEPTLELAYKPPSLSDMPPSTSTDLVNSALLTPPGTILGGP